MNSLTIPATIIVALLNIFLVSTKSEPELLTAIVFTTVGASGPTCHFIYPSYYIDMSHWPNGLDNLTDVGMSEDYIKGQRIMSRYETLFDDNLNESHLKIVSNPDYKSKVSTSATYNGLVGHPLPRHTPVESGTSDGSLNFTNLQILTNPDLYLNWLDRCDPLIDVLTATCKKSKNFRNYVESHAHLVEVMKNNTGYGDSWTPFYVASILATLGADQYHNYTLPHWAEPNQLMGQMRDLFLQTRPKSCQVSPQWFQIVAGLLLADMSTKLKAHSRAKRFSKIRLHILRTHKSAKLYLYTTYYYMLTTLFDLFDISPTFHLSSSTLTLELWSLPGDSLREEIRFVYSGGYDGIYREARKSINFEDFLKSIKPYLTKDVKFVEQTCSTTFHRTALIDHPEAPNC